MQLARGDDHRVQKSRDSFSPPPVIPTLSREFVARRISEGETGRLKEELKCQACGKGYKHISSLAKHLWEHTPEWNMTSRLLISKHQQVQLLEAASILVSLNEEDESNVNNESGAPRTPDIDSPLKTEPHDYHEPSNYRDTKLLTPGASDSSSPSPPPVSSNAVHHHHHHHHHHHYHHPGQDKNRTLPISTGGIAKRRASTSYNPPSSINRRLSSSLASRSAITDYLLESHDDIDGLQSPYPRSRRLSNIRAPKEAKKDSESSLDDDYADDEDNKHEESVFGDMDD